MPNFTDLPRELRDMIYKYSLVVSKAIQPYRSGYISDTPHDTNPQPTVALTQVNKHIGAEAAAILYGHNTWYITSTTLITKTLTPLLTERVPLSKTVWRTRAPLFRHVKVRFDDSDVYSKNFFPVPSVVSNEEHEQIDRQMVISRGFEFRLVRPMMPTLLRLEVDISNLHCGDMDCCEPDQARSICRGICYHLGSTVWGGVTYWKLPLCRLDLRGRGSPEFCAKGVALRAAARMTMEIRYLREGDEGYEDVGAGGASVSKEQHLRIDIRRREGRTINMSWS